MFRSSEQLAEVPLDQPAIGAALAYSFRLTIERAREPGASLPNHGEVIERIRMRDSDGAFASMSRLLNIAIVDLGLSPIRDQSN